MELRRDARVPADSTGASLMVKGSSQATTGVAKDISVGGIFIVTDEPPAFNAELVVTLTLPGQTAPVHLPGVVRWIGADGIGVQFGLLGARDTHAITEFVATKAPPSVRR